MAEQYRKRLEEGAARMVSDLTESKSWPVLNDDKGVHIVYKAGSPADRNVATTVIDAPLSVLLDATFNYDKRLKWDTNINKESKVLETLSDDISITYQQVDGRLGVSGREFVNARLKKQLPSGAVVVVHNNIDHSFKHPSNPVRGKHHDTGYIITPLNENQCQVNWIVQTELGGWVGMINVRSITGQQMVILLNNLRDYAVSHK